ncbi:19983_t:CDS:2 [Entrophospora sp. SA101]|nr:19983_t:CDS:2 [Entrophospora sp. SA101]
MIVINNLAMWSTSNVKVCTLSRNYQNKYDTKESPTSNYTNNQNRDKGAFKTQLIAYLDIKISVKKGTYFVSIKTNIFIPMPEENRTIIGTRSITRAAVVVPGTFQSTASTNTPPADSTTRNTPLPTSITSNDIISSESSNLNNNQTIVSERQPINSNNSIVDLGSTPTVMSQLQKSNPFGELSALAARIKLKATISGAHRLLPQQKTLLNQSSSSLTSTCLGTEGYSNMRYDLGRRRNSA